MATGAFDEAIKEAKRSEELDPLSIIISTHVSDVLYHARRYDQAIAQAKKTLELDANFWSTHINLGKSYTQNGRHAEAVSELRKAGELSAGDTEVISLLGFAYAAAKAQKSCHAPNSGRRRLILRRFPHHVTITTSVALRARKHVP